jgi:hypothetical protein
MSTATGKKDFVAVGTSINRGEDLAVKGAVGFTSRCYFEVLSEAFFNRFISLR